jgi:polar amino acid transport system substrate-binding protein
MKTALKLGGMLVLLASGGALQAATISIVADEWCPYNCTPGDERPGYMIEIVQKVLGEAGHTIDYRNMPWSRAIEEARRGKFDAIVGAAQGDAPDFVFPGEKLGVSANVLMVKSGTAWRYSDLDSLQAVSLGTIRDYSYGDELDAYITQHEKDAKRVQVASGDTALETNFRKLDAGRIDVLVEDRNVIEYYLAGAGQAGAYVAAGDLGEDDLFIAFSPANKDAAEYARLLGEGVQKLRASGELAVILKKYGLKDWQ